MGSFVGRYTLATTPGAHTMEDLAHHWIAEMAVATTAAVPSTANPTATAVWNGLPTSTSLPTAHNTHASLSATCKIPNGICYLEVDAADTTTAGTIVAQADAIDKAVFGSMTVDGAMAAADTLTFLFHHAEDAIATIWAAAVAHDGFAYALIDAEVIKITGVDVATHTITCVRGAQGSTAETWLDDAAIYWYCGSDNTIVGVDDASVWGTVASHTAAGGHLVLVCGTEQMLVTELTPHSIPHTLLVTRGYDGTTAALHADNAAVTQYIDEQTCIFDVSDGAKVVETCFYKTATGGTEVWGVVHVSTNRITVERGLYGTAETVMANGAAPFRLWGPEIFDAALTAVNTIADGTFQEAPFGTPICELRVPDLVTETIVQEVVTAA
jgi:hypothetical protein